MRTFTASIGCDKMASHNCEGFLSVTGPIATIELQLARAITARGWTIERHSDRCAACSPAPAPAVTPAPPEGRGS